MVALAVMAKQPLPGRVKTRLCPPLSPGAAADLADCLLHDAVDQLRRIPGARPVIGYDPPEAEAYFRALAGEQVLLVAQEGGDLGERMQGVLSRLLFEHAAAMVLGADLPGLPDAFLVEAVTRLTSGADDVVLGPTADGGYYAIGLRAAAPALFAEMPWSTSHVLEETVARAKRAGLRVHLLPAWRDLDDPADLARLKDARLGLSGRTAACLRASLPAHARTAPDRDRITP
jgi:rSAM/selenodomain-associated transferase 1